MELEEQEEAESKPGEEDDNGNDGDNDTDDIFYQFDGKLYLQTSGGGPIGLKLTGVFRLNIHPLLYERYVDDLNMALKVKKRKEGEEEQLDKKTARELREIANTIMPRSIVMEEDYPSNHTSGKLPILDMVMWVQDSIIFHEHYSKPMASRAVVMAKSAFPAGTKKNILLEEGSRRMRNCSPELPRENKVQHLNSFCVAMSQAGHTEQYRTMIITRVLARYQNSLKNHLNKSRKMYRSRVEREATSNTTDKSSWFKKDGFTNTLAIPTTPGGRLAALVRKTLERCPAPGRTRTRVVER